MKKKGYKAPEIQLIPIDSEISLALESTPPVLPGEDTVQNNFISNDPFKQNIG